MSALREMLTRGATASTASAARLTTAITSSHSPSTSVNIASVWFGRPLCRTTRTASATAAPTSSPMPSGVTENAMIINVPSVARRYRRVPRHASGCRHVDPMLERYCSLACALETHPLDRGWMAWLVEPEFAAAGQGQRGQPPPPLLGDRLDRHAFRGQFGDG